MALRLLAKWFEAQRRCKGLDRFAGREAEAVAALLEAAVVQAAAVAQLLTDLVGDVQAHELRRARGE